MARRMLEGVRVLDLTQYLAGPTITRLMAELGADVIKVEVAPGGDASRHLPMVKDGRSTYYVQQNRGKRSICVDFKHPDGVALIKRLAAKVDVVTENFGPGVLEKRGLDYASLKEVNPSLVMASVSAYGKTGPWSHKTGYDMLGQAASGMMHVTGEPDGPPLFTGSPIADVSAGVHAFAAVGYALFHRAQTGEGAHIDVALAECLVHMHSIAIQSYSYTHGEQTQERTGRYAGQAGPAGTFKGPSGWLIVIAMERQWERLVELMGRPELLTDPRFADSSKRGEHREALNVIIEEWLAGFPDNEAALACLDDARIPAGPVLAPQDLFTHPQAVARQWVREVHDRALGSFAIPGAPFKFSNPAGQPPDDLQAPFLGEHNAEVLLDVLGCDQAEIDRLASAGVIQAARI
ncbi:MAG: CaiB/BaiF CoA transferase family protein [Acidimicrobiales bacterium]